MTIEVTNHSELERWRRRALIKTIEKILGAAASGPDHVRLRQLFCRSGIITKKRKKEVMSNKQTNKQVMRDPL